MAPTSTNHWKNDTKYNDLLNYLIKRTENIESPMGIRQLVKDFKKKSGAAQPISCLRHRAIKIRTVIHRIEHIDTNTKVKVLFALSAPVHAAFLKQLREDALVEVDEKKRITHYKANDGRLELRGGHSLLEKHNNGSIVLKSRHHSLINNYSKNKNDEEKEMRNFIEFFTEKCENVNSPLSIQQLAKDFNKLSGSSRSFDWIQARIREYRHKIQKTEFSDTSSKVKQLFGLSATLDPDYLEKLRKVAVVEVDDLNRITKYTAKNGGLTLHGDHSRSAKSRIGQLASKRAHQKLIRNYFENKNNSDAVPEIDEEKEMRHLIEFINEKCDTADTPLCITQLTKDFNKNFGISRSIYCIYKRVKSYCREVQKTQFLDNYSKVKQLFCLGATLNSDFLKELRKDASVGVDDLNRITKYTANDGHLTLYGDHSQSAKTKSGWIVRRKNERRVKKHCITGDGDESEESETENGYSEEDIDEYSSKEFDSEFDSDDENDHPNETEELKKLSNGAVDNDNCSPIRNRSPTEISIADNFDFDSQAERGEDQENDPGIIGNTSVKTRSGRLSKKRHLDAEFSYNLASSRSLGASMNTNSASSKPAKQKKIAIKKEQASSLLNQSKSPSKSIRISSRNSSLSTCSTESAENMENQDAIKVNGNPSDYHKPRNQEMDDYDYNPREDNTPESSSIDNRLEEPEPSAAKDHNPSIEAQNIHNRSDAIVPEPEPVEETFISQNKKKSTPPTNGKEVTSQDVPIKVEHEEPITVEDPTEDIKPVTAHNPKIKFFEAMQSLILFLDSPSLSNLQSKINQKIRKMKGPKEVLQNNELIPALELLIARMTNHSVIDISKDVKSVSLIQFFCYLKASILNSKMIGVEGLVNNISGLIEKSQNRRIPLEKVANALRATLDFDRF